MSRKLMHYFNPEYRAMSKLLKSLGVKGFTRRDDGTFFVPGDIDLSCKNLTRLPDLSNVHVGGDFLCDHNRLTTLEGAPYKVDGNFMCHDGHLITLLGAPKSVGGDFDCTSNQLTTLQHAPENIGRNFPCDHNRLVSLKGAPEKVSGGFSCTNNKLSSLEGAPAHVSWHFHCHNNNLASLKGAPAKFATLTSNFGQFKNGKIPPELLTISETAKEELIRKNLSLQTPIKTIRRIKIGK